MKTQMFYGYGVWWALDSNPLKFNYVPAVNPERITKAMQLGLTPNEARRKQNKSILRRLTISNATTLSPE